MSILNTERGVNATHSIRHCCTQLEECDVYLRFIRKNLVIYTKHRITILPQKKSEKLELCIFLFYIIFTIELSKVI